jgi:hypothetical protein
MSQLVSRFDDKIATWTVDGDEGSDTVTIELEVTYQATGKAVPRTGFCVDIDGAEARWLAAAITETIAENMGPEDDDE